MAGGVGVEVLNDRDGSACVGVVPNESRASSRAVARVMSVYEVDFGRPEPRTYGERSMIDH